MAEPEVDNAPEKYAQRLRRNKKAYQRAFESEGKIWGEKFSSAERRAKILADQAAAAELGLNQHQLNLMGCLKGLGSKFKTGLSLACGDGRAERRLMKAGRGERFHGIDVAPKAVEAAQGLADADQLAITYEVADLNSVQLAPASYDLVVTQNCLHHVLELEHLAEQVWGCLRPDGLLWIQDYIGESQFQYSDARIEIANRWLGLLPEELRYDSVNDRTIGSIERRPVGQLVSPFEAVRSLEIMPIFLRYFEVVRKRESRAVMHLVCPKGFRGSYLVSEASRSLFKMMAEMDEILIESGALPPAEGRYLLRRRAEPLPA